MNNAVLKKENFSTLSALRRYLSLWFPYLPFEKSRSSRPDDIPAALVEKQRGALRLAACNMQAREAGLRPGMALAEARAIVPQLAVADMDRAADHAMLLKIASFCERFTPLVALDGETGLLLDITGCVHLFGDEFSMVSHIAAKLKRFTLGYALAGTPDCAHVLSRFSAITHVPPGGEAKAVAGLRIAALEAPQETTTALIRAGLKTIGDLSSRPSQLLTARFGAGLTIKLNRILGREDVRITPLRPAPAFIGERLFAEPLIHMDHVIGALEKLITQLCIKLEAQGEGGRSFEASFFRSDGEQRRIGVEVAEPMRDAQSLTRLFALRLETLNDPLDPGFGFDALRLCVLRGEALSQTQRQLDGKIEDDSSEATLLNRLSIRFGPSHILRFVARDSHDPLRAASIAPASAQVTSAHWNVDPLPRPLQLFVPPQPIEVMAEVPDGPPLRFRWRKILHQVKAAEGPERIESEWWRDEARPVHDYYRVEDSDGMRFWIFREGLFTSQNTRPRWFMHGLFP